MSEIILPPGIALPKQIQPVEAPKADADDETKATALPTPVGHKLLCIVPAFFVDVHHVPRFGQHDAKRIQRPQ